MPRIEGNLQPHEEYLCVALVANQRRANQKPQVSLVVKKPTDDDLTKKVKDIITGMTDINPKKRFSAEKVRELLNVPVRKLS